MHPASIITNSKRPAAKNSLRFAQKSSEGAGAVAHGHFRGHHERFSIDRPDFVRKPIDDENTVAVGAGFYSFRVVADGNPLNGPERRKIEDRNRSAILVGRKTAPLCQRDRVGPLADRHAAKEFFAREIDDGHVVAFDIRHIGARALRIDGDAKGVRADLDRAFAGQKFLRQ
jgi:hypothetical protein